MKIVTKYSRIILFFVGKTWYNIDSYLTPEHKFPAMFYKGAVVSWQE